MSDGTPPSASIRKLPVGATVFEAYRQVFGNAQLLVRAVAFPYCLTIFLVVLTYLAKGKMGLAGLIFNLILVPTIIFGVAWYRAILLGPIAGQPPLAPPWKRRHWRFLGYYVAVFLISFAVAISPVLVADALTNDDTGPNIVVSLLLFPAIIINCYLLMRLSFVFPAIAVDERYGLKESWLHTKGQGFRLFGAITLTAMPIVLLTYIFFITYMLTNFVGVKDPLSASPIVLITLLIFMITYNYLLIALLASAISIAFRTCTGWVPAVSSPPAQNGASG